MSPHPVIIEGIETAAGWQRFRDGIVEILAPEGPLEEDLAENIALLRWRLKRVTHYETAILNHQVINTESDLATAEAYHTRTLSKGELPQIDPLLVAAYQQTRVIPERTSLDKIMRYEAHLHRLCIQTLHELEAIQLRRQGRHAPLARLDISAPPAA
ncbi:MAG: hypothetical protein A2Y74_03095 [Actinobacteria bacterium RBG_13_63_9]|nr:MAG: hypothetical protein A2Y74_03095 [Actinobacteria bacterium RBG_13_63_9]